MQSYAQWRDCKCQKTMSVGGSHNNVRSVKPIIKKTIGGHIYGLVQEVDQPTVIDLDGADLDGTAIKPYLLTSMTS